MLLGMERRRKKITLSMMDMFTKLPDPLPTPPQLTFCDLSGLSYQMASGWVWPIEDSGESGERRGEREAPLFISQFPSPRGC